ncbi:MAG: hypothetical protein CVU71_07135 [Deltaproteobacteria bacterium HGW-Deltaproteobacteria-6]|jgi:hypothetical protein|nr:MAG: hypothetical protein CVU71_07135 [Deltaproteobacteria bacterium HGW-Deltaproteobacteria-6]
MSPQTARVTFLTTTEFKAWLKKEANKSGVSISEFIRLRCKSGPSNREEMLLGALAKEVEKAVKKATKSLDKGIKDTEAVLKKMREDEAKRAKK